MIPPGDPSPSAPRDDSREHPLVVFDGACNFCSWSVHLILGNDRDGAIRFAPLQSRLGAATMQRHGLDPLDAATFLLVEGDRAFVRSEAVVEVARRLRLPWRALALLRLLPRPLRDAAYRSVARNRYRWFGKRATCFIPSTEERSRFLDLAE